MKATALRGGDDHPESGNPHVSRTWLKTLHDGLVARCGGTDVRKGRARMIRSARAPTAKAGAAYKRAKLGSNLCLPNEEGLANAT